MPLQPPASASQKQPPPPGLSRTRSLRRPQAGPSAAAAAAAAAKNPGTTSSTTSSASGPSSSSLPARHVSPTSSPKKPAVAAPLAASHGAPGTGTGTTKPPLRTISKPPSASRTGLLFSSQRPSAVAATTAPQSGAAPRRPVSSGGLPSGSGRGLRTESAATTTARGAPSSSSTALARGHARTRSTSTVTASATSLTAATVLRPPSAQSAKSASSGGSRPPTRGVSSTMSTTAPTGGATAPISSSLHRRQLSATASRLEERSSAASAGASRPAFNNNLQHYSPAKSQAPKPRIAAILAPPASPSKQPANVALSAEMARLQTALLHVHLLHREAAAVTASWHASARRTLIDDRFAALSAAHAELAQRAAQRAEDENAEALLRWGADAAGTAALEERIQTLDAVLSGVWALTGAHLDVPSSSSATMAVASAGRYARVARRFEQWADQTAALAETRRRIKRLDDLDKDEDCGGISALDLLPEDGINADGEKAIRLDAAWHDECAQLVRKLSGWQQQLDALGGEEEPSPRDDGGKESTAAEAPPPSSSSMPSLTRILAGCRGLVAGMLAELRMMRQLEKDAAEAERAWVRTMIASASMGGDTSSGDSGALHGRDRPARAGAIWRVM